MDETAPIVERLLSVLVELSFARELDQVTEITRRRVRQLTAADGVTFVLRQGDECYYADEESIAPLWKGRRFPMSQCVSGWAMLNRQAAVIPDIYQDSRVPTIAYRPTFVKSLLMVPVRTQDPVAAVGVYWGTPHTATAEEQSLVQAVANGAALAMENVQLVADLEAAAERERTARRLAERANQLTDQFLATVSHELRTPLNVIHGWLWRLRQPRLTTEITRQALDAIDRNAAIQARLVEDLLDASRAMAGTLRLECGVVDLNVVCARQVEAMQAAAEAKNQVLELCPGGDELPVFGDTVRLQQVVRNLVENAIKFTPQGGTIALSARRHGSRARVSVRDTGIGLQDDALRRVFDRFWQFDGRATREAGGLGLGLTLVHELVRLHSGTVTAESAGLNAGSTVTFELPLVEATATTRQPFAPDRATETSPDARLASSART
jgi:two-component system CheB/CheR fusion protein